MPQAQPIDRDKAQPEWARSLRRIASNGAISPL